MFSTSSCVTSMILTSVDLTQILLFQNLPCLHNKRYILEGCVEKKLKVTSKGLLDSHFKLYCISLGYTWRI